MIIIGAYIIGKESVTYLGAIDTERYVPTYVLHMYTIFAKLAGTISGIVEPCFWNAIRGKFNTPRLQFQGILAIPYTIEIMYVDFSTTSTFCSC
jgi:hypothetical protein